jgi:hypothetical protein
MTIDGSSLGDIAALATALGLLDGSGLVADWFENPGKYVGAMLRDQAQRDALVQFVQAALGDQAAPVTDDPGRTWVPLFGLTEAVDLFAVLEPNDRGVLVSIGVRIAASTPTTVAAEVRVPLLRVNQGSGVVFLPGLDAASNDDTSDATADLSATVTIADTTLNSVGLTASVPLTKPGGQFSGTPAVGVAVHGLMLPGSSQPLDVSLDSASAIGPELAHLLTAVMQAEAASATGAARDLLGMTGLLPAGGAIPPLPVADILAGGLPPLRQWLQSLVGTPAAMQAWAGLLADLTGATVTPGGPPYGISLSVGRAVLGLTVDVAASEGGDPVITPGVSLSVATPLGGGSSVSEVSVSVDASLARIQLGAHPGVQALPLLSLLARYGGDSGTIVSVTSPAVVTVGALHAGLGLDDGRKPVLLLGAERVDIGSDATHLHHHDLLDLTSPDALADVGSEALDAVVAGMLAGLGAAGNAVSVLIGLTPPASRTGDASWPALSATAFVADPVGAVAAFLRSVVALGGTGLTDLLSVLPGLLGSAAAGAGTGTADQPWTLDLVAGAALSVWQDGSVLHLGARVAPALPPLGGAGGPVLGLALVVDGLAVTLPPASATGTPFKISVAALPSLALEVTLSSASGLTFGTGYQVSISAVRLTLAWGPASGLAVSFDLPGATVAGTPLPPIALGPGGRFAAPLELPWELASQAAASALRAAAPAWAQGLPDLLGFDTGAFDAAGGLVVLISDPLRFLRTLLATALAGQAGPEFAASLAAVLSALTGGAAGTGVAAGLVTGSGGPDDPFTASLGTAGGSGTAAPEAVLWLEPAGPPPAGPGALEGVLESLGRWLDGDPGAAAVSLDTVGALLGQAAAGTAELRGLLAGRMPAGGAAGVSAGLSALQARVAGGDGLLPGTSAEIPGATSVPLPGVTHSQLSSAVDLAAVLGAAPDLAAVVYVTGPFEPPWPGTDAVTFDMTAPGLAATGFDVSRASTQDGPWHVRLAARAACPGASADDQLQEQAARLQRVTDAVAGRHPGAVVLVAHGSAGQAARVVASQTTDVGQLVLLGVPATGLPLDVLDVPPAADVLQLLRRLLPAPDPGLPDDANLAAGRAVIDTLGAVYDSALAPANDFLPPQALGAQAPPVWSVRGAIDPDATTRALAAVVRADVYAVAEGDAGAAAGDAGTAGEGWTPPTALRGGLRITASSPPATAGPGPAGVAVDVDVTLSAELVSLEGASGGSGAPDAPPAIELVVTLSRPGGWLAGGPQGVPAAPDVSRTPSLRRAELRVSADLAASGAAVRARITLSEVNALGLVADSLVLGEGGGPVTPEARVLLGRLASTLGPAPAGGPLAGLVQLLAAAGLTDPTVAAPAVGLSVDAVTKLVADPAGQLRGALAAPAARADAAAALRQVFGDTTSTASMAAITAGGIALGVDLGAPTAALHVSTAAAGFALPGGVTAAVNGGIDAQGHWSGSATLAPSGPPGPAGTPQLRIAAGPAGATVGLHFAGGLAQADLSLWPLPSGESVAGMLPVAAALFAGQLARDLIGAVRDLDQARLDPVLEFLGLLDGSGATARVRLPAGLVTDPGGWLGRTLAGQGLDPDRVASLVDAVRELAGLPAAAHGTLPLPLGVTLTAGPGAGGGLAVTLAVTKDAGDLHLACSGGLTVRSGTPPVPLLSIAAGPAGGTAALQLGLTGSDLTAALVLGNGSTLQLYPSGPGLGSLTTAAVTAALPLVLEQLEQHAPDPVPAVLAAVRSTLSLGTAPAAWDPAALRQLAADPAGELERRLAASATGALASLIEAAKPALPPGWSVDTSDPQAVTLSIGTAPVQQQVTLGYAVSPPAFSLSVAAGLALEVSGLGITGAAHVTVDGTGLRLADVTVGIDPAHPATVGSTGLTLAPFARLTAGSDAAGGARAQAGLAVTAGGHVHALTLTVAAGPPLTVTAGSQTDGQPDGTPDIAAIVTGFVIPALADVALADPSVTALLGKTVLGGPTVSSLLQGVVLTGSSFDPSALDPSAALQRLLQLAGNVASAAPGVTIGDHMRVEIAKVTTGPTTTYGVGVTVDPGERVELNSGDIVLAVEVDSSWTDILPAAPPGLSVMLLDHGATYGIAASPSVVVNGVGLRVLRGSGPLLDSGLQIGSVALYGLLDISANGVQAAGGKLELADLAVAVAGAAGSDNAVAQGVLGDAASGGAGGSGDNTPLTPQFSPSLALEKPAGGALKWSLRAGDGNGPWWIVIQRSFGPLHVEQIGFGVDQDGSTVHGLRVLIDGGLSMLGLSIDVEDLSVGATWPPPPSPALTDPHAWSIDLAGLAVGYSGGSVSLAGALRKRGSPPDYTGVLIAHLGPYGLTAFGGYGQFTGPDGSKYTALFVVAGITAPIGGPPAFFVTGLGGGVGVNRQLVLPATLDDFPNYPLVAALDPHSTLASDPETALDELSAAFPPERGNFWFAAGVSFTSFALVDVTAVVAVSVGDGFQVALLGIGRMALPTTYAPLAQVELAMQARFSTNEGALVVQAQLTQNSWLLTPDCRLTGGFAYASFFGANPNAGQTVLSVGGYHPDFHHDGYPVVPRVGYVWSVASVLTISGQSYFALTSEAIMAGTQFTAALDLGFLWASLSMGIDAIVYFDPFSFDATGYASIAAGVTISVDLGFLGTIQESLSFHLGAQVKVHGPDFSGSASIDLDVTSTTISFGSGNDNSTHQLSWADFSAKYLTAGGASVLSAMPQAGQLTGTVTTPAGTTPTGDQDKPWKFVAEWSLSVATTAAATAVQLPSSLLSYAVSEVPGIASMAIDALTSTLTVTIAGSAGGDVAPPILGPGDPGQGLRVALITAPLPKGVWTPNPNDGAVPSGDTITAGTGFVLQAEATVEGATPEIPLNQIEPTKGRKPLPFAQEAAARPQRQGDDDNAAAFAAAQASGATGSGGLVQLALGYLTGGPLSEPLTPLAMLGFSRDRVAPPRPGLLTEGMVSPQTPPPATTPVVTPPPPVIDTTIHPPVIVAVLGGGPVPVQRPVPRTSVAAAVAAAARTALAASATPALPATAAPAIPPVAAPTLGSAAALTDPAFAAALSRLSPAPIAAKTGLQTADGGPVSLRAATPAELRPGPAATAAQATQLSDSTAALLAKGLALRPGDVIVTELPNAARDLDASRTRHTVTVQGDAAVRVVALSVAGRVLADATGVQLAAMEIPQHTARVALWCVGGDGTRPAGLAGWADVSRLPQAGARTLLGADAVVNGVPAARRGAAVVSTATVPAATAAAAAGFVTTRLPADTQVIVVSVDPAGEDRDLTGLTLGLQGAARLTGPDGEPVAPTVVTAGARMHLLYGVVPAAPAASAGAAPAAVEVTVGTSASWRLTGVLGGPADVATTAARIAAQGAAAVVAPLLRAPTGSARVSWHVPPEVS